MIIIYVSSDGVLSDHSKILIRRRLKQRGLTIMELLRRQNLHDRYIQFVKWLNGARLPYTYTVYVNSLIKAGIIDKFEVTKYAR